MDKKAVLKLLGNELEVELPILSGTIGPGVLNIKELYRITGLFTYDPGFASTASCSSAITFIDGNQGILRYRGHDVNDLAENYDFISIVYLLLYSILPVPEQREEFLSTMQKSSKVPESVANVIKAFPNDAHPMSILIACFASLAAFYYGKDTIKDLSCGISAIAQIPSIVAMIYRHINSKEFINENKNNESSYSQKFLTLMFGDEINYNLFTNAIDKILILHADHEQNASTAAVRLSGSTGSNLFACLAAGVTALWGKAHGGANEAVVNMLQEIEKSGDLEKFIAKAKDDKDPFKLMGFGHRVYKNYDPRARILKQTCNQVLSKITQKNRLLEIAIKLEEIALKDEYFIERKLYPNVDFYSGIIMNAVGIPLQMFTPIFALARTTGWVAQWYEMIHDQETRICRPRQLYIGK
ncbi:citrate (Si)-synthase [Wolbachia pipientis]|uniref:Citrate synthase n=1 Tax=Wolbachia pipientis TaxID=955 RepID=A0A1E7QKI5_WOLPI|nr:citrate synthase [Wolbachia pipientis]OEY86917.1 citrate (Si)-synthase [Wolbachia pipientis]